MTPILARPGERYLTAIPQPVRFIERMPARHLYVHVPFCTRRCTYCDFSIAVRRVTPVDEFIRCIGAELRTLPPDGDASLATVYLGGGTPSRLGGDGIQRIIDSVHERFSVDSSAELTIEANPEDVSVESASAWLAAGINRVSLGVQSFDDDVLKWMHRVHDSAGALAAFHTLRESGFDNISIDLIFALPEKLERDWERDLACATALGPDHVSLYGLTVEQHTPLSRWESRGDFLRADEDRYAGEFLLAHEMMTRAGLDHYEVSNFARPSRRSRHNSAYWSGASYLGIGPSAHSFDGDRRWWNARNYADWVQRIDGGRSPVDETEHLTDDNRKAERVYLGLRTDGGLAVNEDERARATSWEDAGWAVHAEDTLRLTPEGWLRLDSIAAQLTAV